MSPRIPALAQSESKSKLFLRLGLQENNQGHKELYDAMKRDAVEGRRRLIEKEAADSRSVINETAIHSEILEIYDRASPRTRAVYDLGRDRDGPVEENWIIRWMLWHAFRYRDQRNNRNRRAPSVSVSTWEEEDDSPVASTSNERPSGSMSSSGPTTRYYWDPVRNQWRAH